MLIFLFLRETRATPMKMTGLIGVVRITPGIVEETA